MSVHKGKRGSGGRVTSTLQSCAVSNLDFYMDLESHLFKQFRIVSLGRVLWDLACN